MRICYKCMSCHLVFLAVLAIPLSLDLGGIEQFHMMLLKEQEESLETLSFKTFYYTFPIINCQKLASGQRILSFVYTQAKTLFYLPKLQDFLCAELNLKP